MFQGFSISLHCSHLQGLADGRMELALAPLVLHREQFSVYYALFRSYYCITFPEDKTLHYRETLTNTFSYRVA